MWREHKKHVPNCPNGFYDPPVLPLYPVIRDGRLLRKIHMDNDINAAFVDTGHVVSCIDRAIRMDRSPVCRDAV